MPISAARLQRDLERIALATATPGRGAGRPTFSTAWAQAVDYVVGESTACGCRRLVDAAGNVHLRPHGIEDRHPVWLSGSHLDSVPHGGDFDGVVGVVAPLEVLRAAWEDGCTSLPLELVIFAEEEGTTFGLGMLGSRTWVGTLDAARLSELKNAQGQSYLEAGRPYGVSPERFKAERLCPNEYRGLIEIHIEQGPAMWRRNQPVALVTAINGRRQYAVELRGAANHAGSTSMSDRRDALAGAAEMIAMIEALAPSLGPQVVATVGRIECRPNAVNVIPDGVVMTVDVRAPADDVLLDGDAELQRRLTEIAARRGLEIKLVTTESLPAAAMSAEVCQHLRRAAKSVADPLPETVSGALHDAAILAPCLPTAMLFIASRDGISHNPAEFSRIDDLALAAQILYKAVTDPSG
ncbi:MAG: Zn-dependent hydrolase [Planctomycetaceae bacterium]|nr:Zn-dependent hydrolase [Planctomycetaceae bacterium]